MTPPPLIEVEDLRIDLTYRTTHVAAVEGVSFRIDRGETFGLVGESGCGKSITALALIGLLRRPLSIGAGAIRFDGREIQNLPAAEQRSERRVLALRRRAHGDGERSRPRDPLEPERRGLRARRRHGPRRSFRRQMPASAYYGDGQTKLWAEADFFVGWQFGL